MSTSDRRLGNVSKIRFWRWSAGLIFVGIVAVTATELTLRYLRYDEFPIYDVDAKIGYIPSPNQAGTFAGRYSWTLNEYSMLNEPWVPSRERGVLLISDSLVWGEVQMPPGEKLGSCLQTATGSRYRVWSVGAGSWANLNEVEYLRRNEDVVQNIYRLVWIVNYGDFESRSQWRSDFTHPRRRPIFLLGYLIGKIWAPWANQLYCRLSGTQGDRKRESASVSAETRRELQTWLRGAPRGLLKRSLVVWYPDVSELRARDRATNSLVSDVRAIYEASGVRFLDLRAESRWRENYYNDTIHPTAEGNRLLAEVLRDYLPADD